MYNHNTLWSNIPNIDNRPESTASDRIAYETGVSAKVRSSTNRGKNIENHRKGRDLWWTDYG